MSRLAIPDVHRRRPATDSNPAESQIVLTQGELEKRLAASEELGFQRGSADAETRVRGSERAELKSREEKIATREQDLAMAISQATASLELLENSTANYNGRLEDCLEAASAAMAAHLLIEANRSADILRDLLTGIRKRFRVTGIVITVPESMSGIADGDDFHAEIVTLRPAVDGEALSIQLETDSGELKYELKPIAEELHARLLQSGAGNG